MPAKLRSSNKARSVQDSSARLRRTLARLPMLARAVVRSRSGCARTQRHAGIEYAKSLRYQPAGSSFSPIVSIPFSAEPYEPLLGACGMVERSLLHLIYIILARSCQCNNQPQVSHPPSTLPYSCLYTTLTLFIAYSYSTYTVCLCTRHL